MIVCLCELQFNERFITVLCINIILGVWVFFLSNFSFVFVLGFLVGVGRWSMWLNFFFFFFSIKSVTLEGIPEKKKNPNMVEIFSFPILTVLTSYWGSLLSKCMHCFTSLVWEPRAHAVTSRKLRQKTQVHHVRDLCVSMEVALTVISADAPGCRDTT